MVAAYDDVLVEHLTQLNKEHFQVFFSSKRIFVCGGSIDITEPIPPSFRHRFFDYTGSHFTDIHDSLVKAESFKDYFLDGHYDDLLVFEDDIARISTLVVIFLESPGSLVELGMFVSKSEVYEKLLVIAPQEELEHEDSFIFLGPLKFISGQDVSSLAVYPWPNKHSMDYDTEILKDLCSDIRQRISKRIPSDSFDESNSAHLALLICQIIQLTYPIQISEIELSLAALGIDISKKVIDRYLYLAMKLGFVERHKYGTTHHYYYPVCDATKVKFGKNKQGNTPDLPKFQIALRQSMINGEDDSSRKRMNALKIYNARGSIQ